MSLAEPPLRPDQYERYRRHLALPEFGLEGQKALLEARVLLIGAGGLGCPLALYLAASGVGTLGLVDFDRVDPSNLQRQVLYGTGDVGRLKIDVARERIEALNPDVRVVPHPLRVSSENALDLMREYDVIVDGTDNFPTRYLSNDACVLLGKPNVYGAIYRFEGQVSVFDARRGPCYRCLYPEPPPPGSVPSCAEGGVLGVLPGVVAMLQATEVIKLLTGAGDPLVGRLLLYSALDMRFREVRLERDPECPVCGESPSLRELIDYDGFCGVPKPAEGGAMAFAEKTASEVAAMQQRGERFLLLDVREPGEYERARIVGARLVPLGQLEGQLGELAEWKDGTIVVHCHHGGRSARACERLVESGFRDVSNLVGGIDAWSLTVDARVPRY